jgi:hypothetical protein
VLAWNCGPVPAIIAPGITGMITKEDEEVQAIQRALELDRKQIRKVCES